MNQNVLKLFALPRARRKTLAEVAEHGPERLRPIFDALGGIVSYDDLHLIRLHVAVNGKA